MHRLLPALIVTFCIIGCFNKGEPPPLMELNLYSGVHKVARLGDSEGAVLEKVKVWDPQVFDIARQSTEEQINFNKALLIKKLGMRLYFRKSRLVLIELQEPFRGNIQGKRLGLFSFSLPAGSSSWESSLIKEFGTPNARASGGRFGAESFFYSWGDISFNRMGPNEVGIYREKDIANFRQKNFGRDVKFF